MSGDVYPFPGAGGAIPPEPPPPTDAEAPRAPVRDVHVFDSLKDAQSRIAAVVAGKSSKGDLKALEIDLLDKDFVEACARENDFKAVLIAVAGLQAHSFTGSAKKVEKAIVKRREAIEAGWREATERSEAERRRVFRQAAAKAKAEEEWPWERKEAHPIVEAALARTKAGVRPSFGNVFKALRDDPRWGPRLKVNRLGEVVELDGGPIESEGLVTAQATEWLADTYGLHVNTDMTRAGLFAVAETHGYHPVRDYLLGLAPHDGGQPIATILPSILGIHRGRTVAEQNRYALYQKYMRRTLIAAVARAMDPGCKVDTALILVGDQGARKSTFFKVLFGAQFFGDSPIPIGDKNAAIQLRSTWGYELAEMASLSKRSAEEVKQFLSQASDLFRHIYEKNARAWPRHSVLVGSINPKGGFLVDETGSRRFWPIQLPDGAQLDFRALRKLRDAIWSEALAAYQVAKEAIDRDALPDEVSRWWFEPDEDVAREADAEGHTVGDVWDGFVSNWVASEWYKAGGVRKVYFTTSEALSGAVSMPKERQNKLEAERMNRILRRFGWTSKRARRAGGFCEMWEATPKAEALKDHQHEADAAPPGDEPPTNTVPVGADGNIY